jgi:glutamate synthase (NADPH/NADH) large chain
VDFGLTALERLTHRGGVDADGSSGDGAGLLLSLPQLFFRERAKEQGVDLPETFVLGFCFFSASPLHTPGAVECAPLERLHVGWRRVPTEPACLGRLALDTMPECWQFFVESLHPDRGGNHFERLLALVRKRAESLLPPQCYVCSLSSRTVVYKGLLTPWQFPRFYTDIRDSSFLASFAIFHQRYSTNTQPSWQLAQPFRHVAHNGEINTIVSNRRWLRAKAAEIRASLDVGSWFELLEDNVSDSASLDNAFELKLLEGFSVEEALLTLVPPAFENDPLFSRDVRSTLAALSLQSEPWDGPAALVFSDGDFVGCKLDRNGLRPLRYTHADGCLSPDRKPDCGISRASRNASASALAK